MHTITLFIKYSCCFINLTASMFVYFSGAQSAAAAAPAPAANGVAAGDLDTSAGTDADSSMIAMQGTPNRCLFFMLSIHV